MEKKKFLNKIIGSCALVLCMAAFMLSFAGASSSGEIKCMTLSSYSKDSLQTLIDEQEANDYLYAGLFKAGTTEENLTKANMVWNPTEGTEYVAKFVPEGVLGIKAQVSGALLDNETLAQSSIRFITSVDSLVYKEVGFSITRTLADGTEQELVAENSITKYVYTELFAVDAADGDVVTYKPKDMHASSTYFKTYTVTLVPDNHYNTDLTVTPYWITFDGVKVEGNVGIKTVNLGRSWFYVDSDSTEEELGTFNAPFKTIENALAFESEVDRTVLVKESYEIAKSIEIDQNVTLTSANMTASINAPDPDKIATITSTIAQADSTGVQQMFNVTSGTTKVKVIQMAGNGTEDVRAISVADGATLKVTDAEITGSDNDIYSAGTLSLDGTAYAESIYLATADSNTIKLEDTFVGKMQTVQQENLVTGEFGDVEANSVTNVILADYVEKTQVLTGSETVLKDKYEAFEVSNVNPVYIGSTGTLDPCVARIPQADNTYKYYATLQKAVLAVPADGVQTKVQVVRDITLMESVSIPQDRDRNILLTDDGVKARTIKRGFTGVGGGRMLILRKGNQLVVEGSSADDKNPSLILDGGNLVAANDSQIISVGASYAKRGGELALNSGVKLTGNNNATGGGAIVVFGTFDMTGGVIDSNTSTDNHGGAIYVRNAGSMTMTGGTISNNQCTHTDSNGVLDKDGGAIYVEAGASLTMEDGTITGNKAKSGGAILLDVDRSDDSTGLVAAMAMNGGTISGNEAAVEGGAIYVHANAELTVNEDTTISNNTAGKSGGAIFVQANTTYSGGKHEGRGQLTLSGGSISNNKSKSTGGGAIAVVGDFLMVKGVIASNISENGHGGAIYVHSTGNMTLQDGTIQGNQCTHVDTNNALDTDAGAIYVAASGNLDMQGGTITQNKARSGGAVLLAGSGEDESSASMTMTGGTISENTADIKAGAIFVHANAELTVTDDAVISKNTSERGGGAIYVYINTDKYATGKHNGKGYAMISGGTISENSTVGEAGTTYGGGAICVEGILDITGGVIEKNKTTAAESNGGGVYVTETGSLTMSNGTIQGNNANYGGAIYIKGTEISQGIATLSGGTLTANEVVTNGGGIYVQLYGKLLMSGGQISGNTASAGGGVYITVAEDKSSTGTMTMTGGEISGNTVTAEKAGKDVHVAGVFSMQGDAYVEKLYLISDNYVTLDATLTARDKITEVTMGGYPAGKQVIAGDTTIVASNYKYFETPESSCVYIDSTGCLATLPNVASNVARILNTDESYTYYSSLSAAINAVPTTGVETRVELLKSITLTTALDIPQSGNRNILLTDAGNGTHTITRGFTGGRMIILRKGNQMTIEGSSADDTNPSLILDGANITAGKDQQIIAAGASTTNPDATLIMNSGVKLMNNNSTSGGAAVIVHGDFTMNGGVIDDNESTATEGGAIYIQSMGRMTMTGGTISNNKCSSANTDGNVNKDAGAIYVVGGGNFDMQGGTITDNSAQAGGAILLAYSNTSTVATMTMSGGTISNNTARTSGGAVFVHANAELTMTGGTISGNTAAAGGGVCVYINTNSYGSGKHAGSGYMTLSGGTIKGNTATSTGGGGVYVAGEFTMNSGTIDSNVTSAGFGGGAYIAATGKMTLVDGTISNNACTSVNTSGNTNKDAGAIYIVEGGSLDMQGGSITGNTAQSGAAILTYGTVTMSGGSITGNTARVNGGAIFIHCTGTFKMVAGTISGNTAQNGGAVYLHQNTTGAGTMTMSGGEISGNTAIVTGGGVYRKTTSNTLTQTGGSISGNTAATSGTEDIYNP